MIFSSCLVKNGFILNILLIHLHLVFKASLTSIIFFSLCFMLFSALFIEILKFYQQMYFLVIVTYELVFTNCLVLVLVLEFVIDCLLFLILIKNLEHEGTYINLVQNPSQLFIHHQIIVFYLLIMLFYCSADIVEQNYQIIDCLISKF